MVSNKKIIQTPLPKSTTLTNFLKEFYPDTAAIPNSLIKLLETMATIGIKIQEEIVAASWQGGAPIKKEYNPSGDEQEALDMIAHDLIVQHLTTLGTVYALLSEEAAAPILLNKGGSYIVAVDPLDGSKNIPFNGATGTIFSVYRPPLVQENNVEKGWLQPGREQIAAGYLLYGVTTHFVCTLGKGVHGFVYHPLSNHFLLQNGGMTIPSRGTFYAVNDSYFPTFSSSIQNYIISCRQQGLSSCYVGALVADFHHILIRGGIYMYPPTPKNRAGKLRLLFECNPLAFIAQQAEGKAISSGGREVLHIYPTSMHQQIPFYVGSRELTNTFCAFAVVTLATVARDIFLIIAIFSAM